MTAALPACATCDGPLVPPRRKFCSDACGKQMSRADHLMATYGITLDDWDAIFAEQGNVCAICKRAPRPGETFHLDHEHTKGQSGPLRGILCPFDNTRTVGRLKSYAKAQAMADYFREPPATRALGRVVIAPGRPPKKRKKREV